MNRESGHFLSEEFCFFDGKEKRTKNFTTLTAIVYNPLLQKQIPLAIMECMSDDSTNVGRFGRLFNAVFRQANQCSDKFQPIGWVSNMASSNFNGLATIYGEDVLDKV